MQLGRETGDLCLIVAMHGELSIEREGRGLAEQEREHHLTSMLLHTAQLAQYFRDYRVKKKSVMANSRASTPPPSSCGGAARAGSCQPSWLPNWTAEDASSSGMSWAGQNDSILLPSFSSDPGPVGWAGQNDSILLPSFSSDPGPAGWAGQNESFLTSFSSDPGPAGWAGQNDSILLPSFSPDPGPVGWPSLPAYDPLATMTIGWTGAPMLPPIDQCSPTIAAASPASGATSSPPQTSGTTGLEHIEVPGPALHSGSCSTGQSSLPSLTHSSGKVERSWAVEPPPSGPEALHLPRMGPPAEQHLQRHGTPQDGNEGHHGSQWTLPLPTSSNPSLPGNVQNSIPATQGLHEELIKVVLQQQAMMEAMQQQLQALQQQVMQQQPQQQQLDIAPSRPSASRLMPLARGGIRGS
jgi:hypothetical protein